MGNDSHIKALRREAREHDVIKVSDEDAVEGKRLAVAHTMELVQAGVEWMRFLNATLGRRESLMKLEAQLANEQRSVARLCGTSGPEWSYDPALGEFRRIAGARLVDVPASTEVPTATEVPAATETPTG